MVVEDISCSGMKSLPSTVIVTRIPTSRGDVADENMARGTCICCSSFEDLSFKHEGSTTHHDHDGVNCQPQYPQAKTSFEIYEYVATSGRPFP